MKKLLIKWLLAILNKLDKGICTEDCKIVKHYEAKKIGLSVLVTKKDIRYFRSKQDEKISYRKAQQGAINETMKLIRKRIVDCIDANRLIEFNAQAEGGGYCISGELKVYVRKEEA